MLYMQKQVKEKTRPLAEQIYAFAYFGQLLTF